MIEQPDTMHFLDYWHVIRSRKEIVIVVFLLMVLAGLAITHSLPKVYKASALIQVKEESPDVEVFREQRRRYDPLFLPTQFEIIQSAPVLDEVIVKCELEKKLSRAYNYASLGSDKITDITFKRLDKAMKVHQYRDTELIEIQIELSRPEESAPQEAATIANTIAEVFRDQRVARSREHKENALRALGEELKERQRQVAKAQEKVEEIRQEHQLHIFDGSEGAVSSLSKRSMALLETERIKLSMALADKKARHEKIKSMTPDGVLVSARHILGDPILDHLAADKRKAELDLSQLLEAYGENYPDVVRARRVISEINLKITDAITGLKTGVEADYEAVQATMKTLEEQLQKIKDSEIQAESSGYREFENATKDLELSRLMLNKLDLRYVQGRIELEIPSTTVEIVEEARAPARDDPVRPKPMLNLLVAILMGLSAGVGLAFFVEYLDTSVKTIDDIESYMNVPVIGVIPQKVKPFVEKGSARTHAEAYRMLRTNIQFSKKVVNGKSFCVTSGSPGEGKSLTLFNLAFVCAELGDRVLIVDSDLHRPRQHKIMGIPNRAGLANVLAGEADADDVIVPSGVENMDFMPSGKMSSGVHGLLDSRKMPELVKELSSRYDIVLYDAPPMIGVSDTSLLVRELDGVLLVVQHRKYPKFISDRARAMIENLGAPLVGVVLNNINISRDYSYYSYSYHSYYSKASQQKDDATT